MAGLTFLFARGLGTADLKDNLDYMAWSTSQFRKSFDTNSAAWNGLPSAVRDSIKKVKKYTMNCLLRASDGIDYSEDLLFPLGTAEILDQTCLGNITEADSARFGCGVGQGHFDRYLRAQVRGEGSLVDQETGRYWLRDQYGDRHSAINYDGNNHNVDFFRHGAVINKLIAAFCF